MNKKTKKRVVIKKKMPAKKKQKDQRRKLIFVIALAALAIVSVLFFISIQKSSDSVLPANVTRPVLTVSIEDSQYTRSKLKFSWKPVSGADGYYIYYSTSSNGEEKIYKHIRSSWLSIISGSYTYKAEYSEPGHNYYFRIRAYSGEETSQQNTSWIGLASFQTSLMAGSYYYRNPAKYISFSQNDSRWKNKAYGNQTVGTAGSGLNAFSMAISTLNNNKTKFTPTQILEYANSKNTYVGTDFKLSSEIEAYTTYNVYIQTVTQLADYRLGKVTPIQIVKRVSQILGQGGLVVASGTDSDLSGSPDPFNRYGNFIVIRGVDPNGKWHIVKPDGSTKAYSPQDVIANLSVDSFMVAVYNESKMPDYIIPSGHISHSSKFSMKRNIAIRIMNNENIILANTSKAPNNSTHPYKQIRDIAKGYKSGNELGAGVNLYILSLIAVAGESQIIRVSSLNRYYAINNSDTSNTDRHSNGNGSAVDINIIGGNNLGPSASSAWDNSEKRVIENMIYSVAPYLISASKKVVNTIQELDSLIVESARLFRITFRQNISRHSTTCVIISTSTYRQMPTQT